MNAYYAGHFVIAAIIWFALSVITAGVLSVLFFKRKRLQNHDI